MGADWEAESPEIPSIIRRGLLTTGIPGILLIIPDFFKKKGDFRFVQFIRFFRTFSVRCAPVAVFSSFLRSALRVITIQGSETSCAGDLFGSFGQINGRKFEVMSEVYTYFKHCCSNLTVVQFFLHIFVRYCSERFTPTCPNLFLCLH